MPRIRRVITTRAGGTSAPPYDTFNLSSSSADDPAATHANRDRLARLIGLSAERLVGMRQVHGSTVRVVDGPRMPPLEPGDALVTTQRSLALVSLAADCAALLLADQRSGVIGAAHAGRRGAAAGVALRVVAAMQQQGSQLADIDVLIGPAVCGACYEVPAAMRDEVEESLPGSACSTRAGTPGLDIRAGLEQQLTLAGVGKVVVDPACTMEDRRFYSYRRDGETGRFAGVIWQE